MVLAYGTSAPKSVTARCNGREQPRGLTPALLIKGRMRLVALRYCGSSTLMSPKVVCQQSFFYRLGERVLFDVLLAQLAGLGLSPRLAWLLGPCGVVLRSSALRHRRLA